MNKAYIRGIFAIGLVGLVLVGCGAKEPLSREETIVAKIGKEKITLSQVDAVAEGTIVYTRDIVGEDFENEINKVLESSDDESKVEEYKKYKEGLIDAREEALQSLIEMKLLAMEARDRDLFSKKILDEKLKEASEFMKNLFEGAGLKEEDNKLAELFENKINKYVNDYNIPREKVIKGFEDSIAEMTMKKELQKEVSISEEEIESFYNENIDNYVKKKGYHAQLLFFPIEYSNWDQSYEFAMDSFFDMHDNKLEFDDMYNDVLNETGKYKKGEIIAQEKFFAEEDKEKYERFWPHLEGNPIGYACCPVTTEEGSYIPKITEIVENDSEVTIEEAKEEIKYAIYFPKYKELLKNEVERLSEEHKVETFKEKFEF
ncbi:peptidyl-prolyl cis-trans isomerase [Clostridium perfringens]|nr:peptidyl-prolyl cis-trans isomerase [Clostridium perfringens]